MKRKINYCYVCGKKLTEKKEHDIRFLECKDCQIFYPRLGSLVKDNSFKNIEEWATKNFKYVAFGALIVIALIKLIPVFLK